MYIHIYIHIYVSLSLSLHAYIHAHIYGRLTGGGGGKGCFDAKSGFFWPVLIFSPREVWILLQSWYFGYEEFKNQGPMAK